MSELLLVMCGPLTSRDYITLHIRITTKPPLLDAPVFIPRHIINTTHPVCDFHSIDKCPKNVNFSALSVGQRRMFGRFCLNACG